MGLMLNETFVASFSLAKNANRDPAFWWRNAGWRAAPSNTGASARARAHSRRTRLSRTRPRRSLSRRASPPSSAARDLPSPSERDHPFRAPQETAKGPSQSVHERPPSKCSSCSCCSCSSSSSSSESESVVERARPLKGLSLSLSRFAPLCGPLLCGLCGAKGNARRSFQK